MSLIKRKIYPFHLISFDTNLKNDCKTARGGPYLKNHQNRLKMAKKHRKMAKNSQNWAKTTKNCKKLPKKREKLPKIAQFPPYMHKKCQKRAKID